VGAWLDLAFVLGALCLGPWVDRSAACGGGELGVVAFAGAGFQAGLREIDLEAMILVAPGSRGRFEGDLVVGLGVCETFLKKFGEVIAGAENQTAAVNGEYLKSEICRLEVFGVADALKVGLIGEVADIDTARSQWIDAVERDAGLPELGGESDHTCEHLLALKGGVFDRRARSRDEGPTWRNPENELAARAGRLLRGDCLESFERQLTAFMGNLEVCTVSQFATTMRLSLVQGAKADRFVAKRGGQGVAVGREIWMNLGAYFGKDGKGRGMWKLATVGAENLVDLGAFVGDGLRLGVDGIDDDNYLGGGFAAIHFAERGDRLRDAIVEHSEILLRKTGDGSAILRCDDDVESDAACGLLA